jgi:tight adherence protein B
MIAPILTFVMVVTVVLAAYWLLVERPERSEHNALLTRLEPKTKTTGAVRATLQKEAARLSSVPALNRLLSHRNSVVGPIQKLIEQSGVRITVGTLLLSSACLALAVYLVVTWFSGSAIAGLVLGAVGGLVPYLYVKNARTRRIRKFEDLFPEALDLITRAMRAGHAFTTGLAMVAEEMPPPIGGEFKLLYDRQNYGLPLPEALRDFADRIPLLDARFFATAVLTQREAGGNLSEVLDNLASVMRERFNVKRDVRVKSAHGRLTGWILSGLPPALALAMFVVAPGNLKLLINDPLGVKMIIGAVVLQVAGTLVIRKLVDIEY